MKQTRYFLLSFLLFVLAAPGAHPQDLAFSIGTWSFYEGAGGYLPAGAPGAFAAVGVTAGISPRIEVGASLVPRITPLPGNDLFIECHTGVSLFADRRRSNDTPAMYINSIADIGFLWGVHNLYSGSRSFSKHIFLRITPIALGNSYYGRRDRVYSVGAQYDFDARVVSLFINVIGMDFFP